MADLTDGDKIPARLAHLRILTDPADGGWVSYLRENSEIRAFGATPWEAVAAVQVKALRWMADAIENGRPGPTEFCIAVGTPTQTPGQAYQQLTKALAVTSRMYLDASTQRQSTVATLEFVSRYLHSLGVDSGLLMPLYRVKLGLEELEEGGLDPLFSPSKQTTRPRDPIAFRVARAALAAALEVRMTFLQEKPGDAEARVVKDSKQLGIQISGAKRSAQPDTKRVKQLRLDYRSPKSKAPTAGRARHVWDETLKRARAAPQAIASDYLETLYRSVLLEAAHYQKSVVSFKV